MAEAPQPPSDFSGFYEQYKQRISERLGPARPSTAAPFTSTPKEPEVGFLGGLIDFISRPLYAVTNIADKALDLPERFEKAQRLQKAGDAGGAAVEQFSALGSLVAAPFTGLFAQSRENKNYTSDILEKISDVSNRNNPNYVDTEDNVDPFIKGVGGFAGDVVLDPLMWVPATWIAKGVAMGGRGLQAAAGAGKKAAEVTKGAVLGMKPVDEVAEAIRRNESPIQNVGDVVNNNPAPAQAALKATDVIADAAAKGELPSKTLKSALRSTINAIKITTGPKSSRPVGLRNRMEKFVDGLKMERIVSKVPAPQRELSFDEWMTQLDSLPEGVDLSDVPIGITKVGPITLTKGNLQELIVKSEKLPEDKLQKFVDDNQEFIVENVFRPLHQLQVEGIRAGRRVDMFGRVVPDAEVIDGAAAAVARLAELEGIERSNAEFLFGADLIASLRRMSPERMAKFLDASQNVLARNGVVEAVGSIRANSAEAKLLARLGVTPEQLRLAQADLAERINMVRAGQQTKNLKTAAENLDADANFVAQLTDELTNVGLGRDRRMIQDAVSGIKNALGVALRNFSDSYLRKKYKFEKYDGELLLTDPRYGVGDARVKDLYGTYVQNDYWTSLSKRARSLFGGFPARSGADRPMALQGTIQRDAAGNVIYRGQLPKYIKPNEYQAYAGFDITNAIENFVLTTGKAGEDFLAAKGVPITIDLKAPGAARAIEHLRFTDMYRVLSKGFDDIARRTQGAGVVSSAARAVYEASRTSWGQAKNAFIARNKERLDLPDVNYDFSNPQVSVRAPEIARLYDQLVSDPTNPAVREAYDALVRESREQYDYMTNELGIRVEFVDYDPYNVPGRNGDLVPDSKSMMEDVLNNRRLLVRDSAADFAENPHPLLSVEDNNIFRAVHEFFGHAASGSSFRAAGEEAAWVSHSSMFSLQARRALTTETRGQNSYYNFLDPQRKQFAPQKAALLPDEFVMLPTTAEFSGVVLDRAMHNRWLKLLFFHAGSGVSRTNVADAILTMINGGTREQVLTVLRSGTTRSGKREIDNWLAGGNKTIRFGHSPGTQKPRTPPGVTLAPNNKNGVLRGYYYVWSSDTAAENLVDAMFASRGYLEDVMTIRRNQYVARAQVEVNTVLPEISRNLVDLMTNPVTSAGAIRAVQRTHDIVDDYIGAIDGTEAASVMLKGIVESSIPATVTQAARSAEKISRATATGNKAAADKARSQKAKEDRKIYEDIEAKGKAAADEIVSNPAAYSAEELAAAEDYLALFNIADSFRYPDGYSMVQLGLERFRQMFSATYRMDVANHLSAAIGFKSLGLRTRKFKNEVATQIKPIFENPSYAGVVDNKTPVLNAATELIQKRTQAPAGTPLAAARADLEKQYAKVFDVTGELGDANLFINSILGTSLLRMGMTLEAMNNMFMRHAVLGKVGDGADGIARLPESGSFFDVSLAVKDAQNPAIKEAAQKLLPGGSPQELNELAKVIAGLDQWRTWKIDNPRQFLLASQTALYETAAKVSYIDNMFEYVKSINLGVDNAVDAKKLGFVKVVSDGDSYFGPVLPNNMYVAPEIAEILQAVDIAFRSSRTLKGPMGDFTNKYLDKLLNTWKYAVTVIRPGHHIRNEIGGQSLRFAALGIDKFLLAERKAYALLALRKNYTDVDMWAGLRANGDDAIKAGETLYSGSKFKIDADDAFRRMEENLFDVGRIVEDLFDEELTRSRFAQGVDIAANVATLMTAKRGGTIEKIALGASEFIEHKARAAHFIQAVMQMADGKSIVRGIGRVAKPKNIEELYQFAIESALKYHPNAASISAFETKIPRRLFPFYSWIKPATVALVEASIMNPGRTLTVIPKASFNLAIAMGIDPHSMYYPFPEDQMFPSFLTEEMIGPQFEIDNRYVSVNPGFAVLDIYNQFLANPVEGVLQATNPFARVPIEIMAGARLGSRAPIRDLSDYIDSSIPGVNYISNISGRSVTGGFEPQRQVETGSKTLFDQGLSAFNWLSGLGVRNYSRSSYINFAEIEARNAAATETESQSFVDSFLDR